MSPAAKSSPPTTSADGDQQGAVGRIAWSASPLEGSDPLVAGADLGGERRNLRC